MFNIGRSRIDIIHSFVETDMNSILDAAGLEIKADNIIGGVGGITEENASFGMEGELCRAFARRTYQTRQPEVRRLVKSSWCLVQREIGDSSVP